MIDLKLFISWLNNLFASGSGDFYGGFLAGVVCVIAFFLCYVLSYVGMSLFFYFGTKTCDILISHVKRRRLEKE